jgi:L-aminopeptidase/D-esterase-like protein
MYDDNTDIPGIRVGYDTNLETGTGCTVVLCDLCWLLRISVPKSGSNQSCRKP